MDAREIESVLEWAAGLVRRVSFPIKTTEAPRFQRLPAGRLGLKSAGRLGATTGAIATADGIGRAPRAVIDGNGFVFIDHIGNVCPSGFLPLPAGNVRTDDLVEVYRNDALFQALRDPGRLAGRCGICEYRDRCGGSRARLRRDRRPAGRRPRLHVAAASGDPPACGWVRRHVPFSPEAVTSALGISAMALGLLRHEDPRRRRRARYAGADVDGVLAARGAVTFDPPWMPDRIGR